MKKTIVAVLFSVFAMIAAPAMAGDAKMPLNSAFSKLQPDKIVTVADFENFNACVNGVGGTNQREIAQGRLNPLGLTISNINVPATGILRKGGSPTVCVATQFLATGK